MTDSEWLTERRKRITGTDVASILGVNPYQDAYELWLYKTGRLEPEDISRKPAVYWGSRLEASVIEGYAELLERPCRGPFAATTDALPGADARGYEHTDGRRVLAVSTEIPWAACTLDFIVDEWRPLPHEYGGGGESEVFEGPGIGEAKTAGARMAESWAEGRAPLMYQVQAQWNAVVCGLSWASIPVLIGGRDFRVVDAPVVESFAEKMLARAELFWRCVRDDIEPDPEVFGERHVTLDLVRRLYPKDSGETVILPEIVEVLDEGLQEVTKRRIALEKIEKRCKDRLAELIGDATYGAIPGRGVWTFRTTERAGYTVEPTSVRQLRRRKWNEKRDEPLLEGAKKAEALESVEDPRVEAGLRPRPSLMIADEHGDAVGVLESLKNPILRVGPGGEAPDVGLPIVVGPTVPEGEVRDWSKVEAVDLKAADDGHRIDFGPGSMVHTDPDTGMILGEESPGPETDPEATS